jgi:AraC-like DNA-binding protein
METIDAIIFVQGFIWGSLLLKRPLSVKAWLGFSFLLAGFVFLQNYIQTAYGIRVPLSMTFGSMLLFFLLSSYYLYESLVLSLKGKKSVPLLAAAALICLLLYQILLLPENRKLVLHLAGIAGIVLWTTDAVLLGIRIQRKTHAGAILELSGYRLAILLLASKGIFAWMLLTPGHAGLNHLLLQVLFACLLFITGYTSVQVSFEQKAERGPKKQLTLTANTGREVLRLMEEKKPYLDCELTLGKVSAMLDMTEHELTRLLHTGMHTSFYELVNSYRIREVKELLLRPEAKKYTIMSAAYESGFNSRSTFYRIFKAYTGMQPKDFMDRNTKA